jgi:nicotinamidase-related amidase
LASTPIGGHVPADLSVLAAPDHTAVLTMEMQRGVVGDLSPIPDLAAAVAAAGTVEATAHLLRAGRAANVRVVHCTAEFRADRAGSAANAPMLSVLMKHPNHLVAGSEAAQLVAELGPEPSDVVSPRVHGVSPFIGTSLDMTLRNLGVRTVVATGVSVNLGVLGLAIEAVNFGYQVVLPIDCVVGVPADYARAVIDNTLALLATRTTSEKLIAVWS